MEHRVLNKEEMISLVGQKITHKATGYPFMVTGFNVIHDCNYVLIGKDKMEAIELLDKYVDDENLCLGVPIEKSADGYTLEEFLKKCNNKFSNIIVARSGNPVYDPKVEGVDDSDFKNVKDLMEKYGLHTYAIKPIPKIEYIKPTGGFRGSVFGESRNLKTQDWEDSECIACHNTSLSYIGSCGCSRYFRTPAFSAEHQPPIGTRFKVLGYICMFYVQGIRKNHYHLDETWIESSDGSIFNIKDIIWIDYERYTGED